MKRDPDEIAAIEKAIAQKYGKETIQDPRTSWNEDKEKDYVEQAKMAALSRERALHQRERVEIEGVFVSRKLLNKERGARSCPVCENYSFEPRDDVYMIKYECCFECWAKYVDGREDRWKKGWRPE